MTTFAMTALCGCATLGGNVKGSFSCAAPDGICAPSSLIDDRALALIAGESGSNEIAAAESVNDPVSRPSSPRLVAASPRLPIAQGDPQRTQERVLRIVFRPYIDDLGRLHEESAVHAVVEYGMWQQQRIAAASSIPGLTAADLPVATGSLAEALDRAEGAGAALVAIDPNLPDPAVVSAARARAPAVDPVTEIRNDVAARLAHKVGRTPPRVVSRTVPAPLEREPGGTVFGVATKKVAPLQATAAPPAKATSTTGLVDHAQAKLQVQTRANGAEEAARDAANPTSKPTRRAAGFPAGVPEEN